MFVQGFLWGSGRQQEAVKGAELWKDLRFLTSSDGFTSGLLKLVSDSLRGEILSTARYLNWDRHVTHGYNKTARQQTTGESANSREWCNKIMPLARPIIHFILLLHYVHYGALICSVQGIQEELSTPSMSGCVRVSQSWSNCTYFSVSNEIRKKNRKVERTTFS